MDIYLLTMIVQTFAKSILLILDVSKILLDEWQTLIRCHALIWVYTVCSGQPAHIHVLTLALLNKLR